MSHATIPHQAQLTLLPVTPSTRYRLTTATVTLKLKEPYRTAPACGSVTHAVSILHAIHHNLDADQEHCVMLCLDNHNRVTGYKVISSGGRNGTQVDLRTLFRFALLFGATALIVSHNQPSGDTTPSREDLEVTRQIKAAATTLDITLHDHIILEPGGGYYSFNEHEQLYVSRDQINATSAATES